MTDEESIAFLRRVQAKTRTAPIPNPPTLNDALGEFWERLANRMVRAEFKQPPQSPPETDARVNA